MAQNIHYLSKRKEREQSKEILEQRKTANQQGKCQILDMHVLYQNPLQLSNSCQFCWLPHTSLFLGWFHSILADVNGRYPTSLASATSWGCQHNPGFTLITSSNDLSGPLCRDMPDTDQLQWLALSAEDISDVCFVSFTLKSEPLSQSWQYFCLMGLEHDLLTQLLLHQLFVVDGFLHCLHFFFLLLFHQLEA